MTIQFLVYHQFLDILLMNEYNNLEKELSELEKEKTELENCIQKTDIELSEMMEKSERLGVVINLIDEKEMRWMELDEMQ